MHIGRLIIIFSSLLSSIISTTPAQALGVRKNTEDVLPFQQVIQTAKELADQPFQDISEEKTPAFLREIGYDQWRDIRFKPEHALWADDKLKFQIHFFLPAFIYNRSIKMNYVDPSGVFPVPFSTDYFDFQNSDFRDRTPADLGYAGFRIHYPLNIKNYYDELIVFLGASYLRTLAKNQVYGISHRGLAINTGGPTGEEFPFFKEFWILKPRSKDRHIVIYALLDSPSITGAYRMAIRPDIDTTIDVECALFPRQEIEKIGIAPSSSMFFFGEHSERQTIKDFRPEVHDSDGLLIATGDEWIWRPLVNPRQLFINAFASHQLKGFGLLQRDTDFDHYQDLESRFERRPSIWIAPQNDWGKGHVELVQIPTVNEYNDNIAAYWVPEKRPVPKQQLNFKYMLTSFTSRGNPDELGFIKATRKMKLSDDGNSFLFVIDFAGKNLESIFDETELTAEISVGEEYVLSEKRLEKNFMTNGWRLIFRVQPAHDKNLLEKVMSERNAVIEMRALLRKDKKIVTEVWSYALVL